MGEADNPGPGFGHDDAEPSDSDHDEWQPLPGEMDWLPDVLDGEFMDDASPAADDPDV